MAYSNPYAKGAFHASILDTVIQSNSWTAREPALKLFTKIATNILSNPTEPKYRKINVEKVLSKFGADFKGIKELLASTGFRLEDGNWVLPETTSTANLSSALTTWTEREAKSAAGRAEAERIRLENQAEIDKLTAGKNAARQQVRSLAQQARAEVAVKPVNSSVGNKIEFGSTLVKAPPPPPAAKGG